MLGRSALLLPCLLQFSQLLQLLGSQNGPNFGRRGLANLVRLRDLLFRAQARVVAHCFHLLIFVRDDWTQLGLLFFGKTKGIVVSTLTALRSRA